MSSSGKKMMNHGNPFSNLERSQYWISLSMKKLPLRKKWSLSVLIILTFWTVREMFGGMSGVTEMLCMVARWRKSEQMSMCEAIQDSGCSHLYNKSAQCNLPKCDEWWLTCKAHSDHDPHAQSLNEKSCYYWREHTCILICMDAYSVPPAL